MGSVLAGPLSRFPFRFPFARSRFPLESSRTYLSDSILLLLHGFLQAVNLRVEYGFV